MDKGGVVDFSHENAKKKSKYKIIKFKEINKRANIIYPKYKEISAKIVQAWWRYRKKKIRR